MHDETVKFTSTCIYDVSSHTFHS